MSTRLEPEVCPVYEHRFTFRCSPCRHEWTLTGYMGELP